MIRRPPRSTLSSSSAASDVYKRQVHSLNLTGLSKQELDVLMQRVVAVAGDRSDGRLSRKQFCQLVSEIYPESSDMPGSLYAAFSADSADSKIDFKQLATACVALSGDLDTNSLHQMFQLYDADKDGQLRFDEVSQLLGSIISLAHKRMSKKEADLMAAEAFGTLDRNQDGMLSQEEFAHFTGSMPSIAEFLRLESQSARQRWLTVPDKSENCPIQ
eukprot:TRINITY_DN24600_c0_g1_i2.p1 TRINITY_DN24600_c0_g1~~TRINITY_DN24600_c0_g1_i2.p1  ORF type:complete len:216 (-),score=61.64 TRINITY_DN24600_c0_g1_i2:209-856(-)